MRILKFIFFSIFYSANVLAQDSIIHLGNDALLDPTTEQKKLIQTVAAAPPGAAINLPELWNLSKYLPLAGYQGQLQGACSAFVVAFGIKTIQESIKLNRTNFVTDQNCLSPTYVFNRAKQIKNDLSDCERGVTMIEALTVLANEGTVPISKLKFYPFDPNGCKTDVSQYAQDAKNYRISSFDAPELNKFEFQRLLFKNYPIAICVKVDDNFILQGGKDKWTDNSPFIWTGYNSKVEDRKRHAMLCVGYDKNGFKILNSWGKNFGVGGFFYISYDFMFTATYDAYIAIDRKNSSKDVDLIHPTGSGVANTDTSMKHQEFSAWLKEGYVWDFNNFRIGNAYFNEKEKVATFQIKDLQENKILSRIDLNVGEQKSFEYKGRLHTIRFNRIAKAGNNALTYTFNIHGKGAYFSYMIDEIHSN